MNVKYILPKVEINRKVNNNISGILSNRIGGFLFVSSPVISKFNGFFINHDLQLYKIIENVFLEGNEVSGVEKSIGNFKLINKKNNEQFLCVDGVNGFVYKLDEPGKIIVNFDCRKVNDLRVFGRIYDVSISGDGIIIEFKKLTDEREDASHREKEFSIFVAIHAKDMTDYEFRDEWIESDYTYDHERKDFPAHRYVYRPFKITAKNLMFGIGMTREKAVAEIGKLSDKKETMEIKHIGASINQDVEAAFICAQESISQMRTFHDGATRIYAGYPWFFQLWSRDENICLGALIKMGDFSTVKDIITKHLDNIGEDGRLPNHIPSPHLGSADGVGWLWKRVSDLIDKLRSAGELHDYISKDEIKKITSKLADSIDRIEKSYMSDGLITNRDNETWMDTNPGGHDPRDGTRIEIQALHLNMLRLMYNLNGEKKFREKETAMKNIVRENFWENNMLADGKGDSTIRPNIFIANYVYPDILSTAEWKVCFEKALDRLWLEWGGLSSIDVNHHLFIKDYSGIDDRSYHRGDSWFWINHIAAICLLKTDAEFFSEYVKKIIKTGCEEILWHGVAGHNAEISSASHLCSKGCLAQAWSATTFIELIMEVYR